MAGQQESAELAPRAEIVFKTQVAGEEVKHESHRDEREQSEIEDSDDHDEEKNAFLKAKHSTRGSTLHLELDVPLTRRKSVTISEAKPTTIEVGAEIRHAPHDSNVKSPVRSALKKPEDLRFIIRSTDPIGQDTAVYEFNKYQMPIGEVKKPFKGVAGTLHRIERIIATYLARLSVLLGRSSGRDKAASVIQYAAMFWGSQPLNLSGIEDSDEAPWKKLEESMSSGRKVFRLGKWIKEYERARVALTAPDSYLGVHPTKYHALVTRFLAVLMNTFSFWYYVFDNMIWAAQANLINRYPREKEIRKMLFEAYPKLSYDHYVQLQAKHIKALHQRAKADKRVQRWKDFKNYASLGRLAFAIVHCIMQVRSLRKEDQRLQDRYRDRINRAEALLSPESVGRRDSFEDEGSTSSEDTASISSSGASLTRRNSDRFDSVGSASERPYLGRNPDELRSELSTRRAEVDDAVAEQNNELIAALCNLGILLNRLKFPFFRMFPLWFIGILGVVSGSLGCLKNWPKFVPKPKQGKVARRRSDSIEDDLKSFPNTPTSQKSSPR